MKRFLLVFLISFINFGCHSQVQDEAQHDVASLEPMTSENKPKGAWKVNKKFDDQGHLISYDSTYTWSSSDRYKNLNNQERDSLIQSFESKFFKGFCTFKGDEFSDFFAQDSLIKHDLFNDSFFQSEFGHDFIDLDEVMQQMLERQREFLEKYQKTYLIEPEFKKNI